MKRVLIFASLLSALALASQASADTVKVGTLSCHENSGWGFVFGASHRVRCVFSGGGREEHYTGDISKFGVDVGYQRSGVLVWSVIAPSSDVRHGALAGHYGGVTAGATVGVGLGANALVGGFDHGITLQPLSIEGTTGLNVAAGIGGMTLRAAG